MNEIRSNMLKLNRFEHENILIIYADFCTHKTFVAKTIAYFASWAGARTSDGNYLSDGSVEQYCVDTHRENGGGEARSVKAEQVRDFQGS